VEDVSAHVVFVDFQLRPGALAAFRELIDANARESVRKEPGCRRFDVIVPEGATDEILLYEIYDDRPAFQAHIKSEHFARFDAASAALVVKRTIRAGALVCEGSA
jgi:autoinducer 2-degrading protein